MANTKVTQELIADDAIGAAQLASNAVVTASIADDAVTSAKLDTNLAVAGSLTVAGTLTANAGVNVDNISIDGTTIALSTGDLSIFSSGSDQDVLIKGNDGGSAITALTLDMSAAGAATFNDKITAVGTSVFTSLDISGDIDVDGTTNLDVVDIDGAVNMASTLQVDDVATLNQLQIPQYVTHAGDTNTYMEFRTDLVDLRAGNVKGITIIPAEVVINEDSADVDFRVESNSNANMLFVNGGTDKVGIGTASPTTQITASTSANISQVAITSSSNAVAWDSTAAANAYHVTTENTTFSAPSNSVEGAIISVELAQGGTVRTIAWNTVFEFAASTAPTVTATANKTDIFSFRYNGSVWQEIGRVQNLAQT